MVYSKNKYEPFDNFVMSHKIAWKIILENIRYFIPIIFVVTLSTFIFTKYVNSINYNVYVYEYGFAIIGKYIFSTLISLWLLSFFSLNTNDFFFHSHIDNRNVATKSFKNLPKLISVFIFALIIYIILALLISIAIVFSINPPKGIAIFQSILVMAILIILGLRYCFVFQIAALEEKYWYSAFKSSLHYVAGHQRRLFFSAALLGLLYLPGFYGLYLLSSKISNILISFTVAFYSQLLGMLFFIWLTIFYIQVKMKLEGDEFFLNKFYNSNIEGEVDSENYKNLIAIFSFSVLLLTIGIFVYK